jgi:hypothetical protein
MPARLSPEEREARKRERARASFSDAAYKKRYDPKTEGYGNSTDWAKAAGYRLGVGELAAPEAINADLVVLGLTSMPTDLASLRKAYRTASKQVHPDVGGSEEAFKEVGAAYERLKENVA